MDQILRGIPKCVRKQDDILIGGNDENENLDILEMVWKGSVKIMCIKIAKV